MECIICLSDETHDNIYKEKIITKCNHYFHKECLFRDNYKKSVMKCSLCQAPYTNEYTMKDYSFSEMSKEHKNIFKRVHRLMRFNNIKEYVISGSFAVYMYIVLFRKKIPEWKYGDIDIYIEDNGECEIENKIEGDVLYIMTDEIEKYTYEDVSNITSVQKYSSFLLKDIETHTDTINKIENYDVIKTNLRKDIHTIVETFDIDCCKIAMKVDGNNICMYIHNSFYVDSCKKDINQKRVDKYKTRGFDVKT